MITPGSIVQAIESFDDWCHPSTFISAVSSDPTLSDADRQTIQALWDLAHEQQVWLAFDNLADCAAGLREQLAVDYPWLSERARWQIANAAAYDMK